MKAIANTQDLLEHIEGASQSHNPSLLGKLILGAGAGGEIGGVHGAAYGALSGLGEHIFHSARNVGIAKASTLVRDAMFNPELARALLEKTPKQVGPGAYANFSKALGRMAVFSTETVARDQCKERAAGGSVAAKLSHEQLVSRLMEASEQAKLAAKQDTKGISNTPDDLVARALAAANKAI